MAISNAQVLSQAGSPQNRTAAGTPTGVPTAISGYAPLYVDTTNSKLYFYSTGAWRDAGP